MLMRKRCHDSLRCSVSCLLFAGILTGCTTLARNFDRLRAAMTKPETDEDSHYYGAFFISSRLSLSELPSTRICSRRKSPQTENLSPEHW
jgi:hypothetical protein